MYGAGIATAAGTVIHFHYGLPEAMAAGTAIQLHGRTEYQTAAIEPPHLHEVKEPPKELYEAGPISAALTLAVGGRALYCARTAFVFWRGEH